MVARKCEHNTAVHMNVSDDSQTTRQKDVIPTPIVSTPTFGFVSTTPR
jgi:hypothetical protein